MLVGAKTIAAFFALITLAGGQLRGEVAPAPVGASVAVVGDSYAAGVGAGSSHSWEKYAALDLGWFLETVRAYPGAGHTLDFEPDRSRYVADMLDWLSARVPSGSPRPTGGGP